MSDATDLWLSYWTTFLIMRKHTFIWTFFESIPPSLNKMLRYVAIARTRGIWIFNNEREQGTSRSGGNASGKLAWLSLLKLFGIGHFSSWLVCSWKFQDREKPVVVACSQIQAASWYQVNRYILCFSESLRVCCPTTSLTLDILDRVEASRTPFQHAFSSIRS